MCERKAKRFQNVPDGDLRDQHQKQKSRALLHQVVRATWFPSRSNLVRRILPGIVLVAGFFALSATPAAALILTLTPAGTGTGTVTSAKDITLSTDISCGDICTATYDVGTVITMTATPAAGSTFTGWSGGGCSGTSICTVTMTENQAVAATFELMHTPQIILFVTTDGDGDGTVTSSPSGISCSTGICAASYDVDTVITLNQTATSGSIFSGWRGSGCSGMEQCQVTMSAKRTVTATFDPAPPGLPLLEGSFRATNSMSAARQNHTATLLSTGQVLIAGGFGGGATAELFDPVFESFFPTGTMTVARHEHTAVQLLDGRVLIAGGINQDGHTLATAEVFDPDKATFISLIRELTTARNRHTATLLPDGRILITGGISQDGRALATAEVFDPTIGLFTKTGNMTTARSRHTATLLADGRVLITGGLGDIFALATAEVFNPHTGSFTATGELVTARSFHTATLLPDDTVLIAGGIGQEATAAATAELFDPTAESFLTIGTLTTARELHTATLLPSGHVLLSGGVGDNAATETFDPANASFTASTPMTTPRQLHTATLLQSGQLLLTGGIGSLATAEMFVKSMPDLAVTITKLKVKTKETGNKLKVKITISNIGTEVASNPFALSLFLSADENLDERDALLQTIIIEEDVAAGEEEHKNITVLGLGAVTGMFAIATFDPVVGEGNIHNNTVAQVIEDAPSITATPDSFPLVTVTRAGGGSGMITSAPEGITCVSTDITATGCASNFPANATVLFTATADPGSVFTGWSGDACNVTLIANDLRSGTCQFVPLLQNRSVIAIFAEVSPINSEPAESAPTLEPPLTPDALECEFLNIGCPDGDG